MILTVILTTMFGLDVRITNRPLAGNELLAGYLIELLLLVDNLFAFLMIFDHFHIPLKYQNWVLTWGIALAVCLRGFMLLLGDENDEDEATMMSGDNVVMKLINKVTLDQLCSHWVLAIRMQTIQ
eukprot:12848907-Ditylum_brightwellii.AAC.1